MERHFWLAYTRTSELLFKTVKVSGDSLLFIKLPEGQGKLSGRLDRQSGRVEGTARIGGNPSRGVCSPATGRLNAEGLGAIALGSHNIQTATVYYPT